MRTELRVHGNDTKTYTTNSTMKRKKKQCKFWKSMKRQDCEYLSYSLGATNQIGNTIHYQW